MLLAGKVVEVLHYQPQYELRSISVAVWTTLWTIIILPPDPSHSPYCKEVNRMTERTYTIKTELSGGAPIHDAVLTEDGINAIAPLLVPLFAAALAAGHEND